MYDLPEFKFNPVRKLFKYFRKKKQDGISKGVKIPKPKPKPTGAKTAEDSPPQTKNSFLKLLKFLKILKSRVFTLIVIILLSSLFGFLAGAISGSYFYLEIWDYISGINFELPQSKPKIIEKERIIEKEYIPQTTQEEKIIKAVKEASPSVVSIIITKDLPIFEQYYYNPFKEFEEFFGPELPEFPVPQYRQKGTEKKEVGGGTGFIITSDGMILTNKHVVLDQEAEYTVLTNDGKKFPAKVLALDPFKDLAIIKIENKKKFKPLKMGDSSKLEIGQTVIAIGNALGEFQNTVSVGVVSGLERTVTASGGGLTEVLENLIQTDAAINRGNSGGPLLNLKGEVIGVNVAMSQIAENIGFAIPINEAKKDIKQVKTLGKIVYPFLGVRYVLITETLKEKNNLPVDYGAWIVQGENPEDVAITPGSAAQAAGLKENDIILEFNDEKITRENPLAKIIMKYNPGDKITLKILREGKKKIISVTLGEKGWTP